MRGMGFAQLAARSLTAGKYDDLEPERYDTYDVETVRRSVSIRIAPFIPKSAMTRRPTKPNTTAGMPFPPRLADEDNNKRRPGAPGTAVITKTRPQTKRPSLYRVLLLNDDYTPMEFVVHVLERFFNKDHDAAHRIMMHVHQHGIGECGVYTYEVAETKVTQVMDFARKHQHPLQCVMEKK
jgi:ATP-dependent Clp protease adaptor protein ClpS